MLSERLKRTQARTHAQTTCLKGIAIYYVYITMVLAIILTLLTDRVRQRRAPVRNVLNIQESAWVSDSGRLRVKMSIDQTNKAQAFYTVSQEAPAAGTVKLINEFCCGHSREVGWLTVGTVEAWLLVLLLINYISKLLVINCAHSRSMAA